MRTPKSRAQGVKKVVQGLSPQLRHKEVRGTRGQLSTLCRMASSWEGATGRGKECGSHGVGAAVWAPGGGGEVWGPGGVGRSVGAAGHGGQCGHQGVGGSVGATGGGAARWMEGSVGTTVLVNPSAGGRGLTRCIPQAGLGSPSFPTPPFTFRRGRLPLFMPHACTAHRQGSGTQAHVCQASTLSDGAPAPTSATRGPAGSKGEHQAAA